jgi:hypothetical protein
MLRLVKASTEHNFSTAQVSSVQVTRVQVQPENSVVVSPRFPMKLYNHDTSSNTGQVMITLTKAVALFHRETPTMVRVKDCAGIVLCVKNDVLFTIYLHHKDENIELNVVDESNVVSEWRLWARELNLPLMIEQDNGALMQCHAHIGDLQVTAMKSRRRGGFAQRHRRPSNIMRKRMFKNAILAVGSGESGCLHK